ncbi:MAG: hypothetical protein ABIP65_06710, partial [Vicinamibacterales bacterium]
MASAVFIFALAAVPARAAIAIDASGEPDSQRLEQAKDFIADEQWTRAIAVLRGAASDTKERNRDEALFWLAHSLHQARDLGAAVETISELERRFPASRWVKPARSLRVEIAQKLHRDDVLWWTATPPAAPVALATPPDRAPPPMTAPRAPTTVRTPFPPPASVAETPRALETPRVLRVAPPPARPPAPPPMVWMPQNWDPDTDLRIQALGSLMRTDSARVIPMLKEIALGRQNPQEASRAVFVLAQSGHADAYATV